MLEQLKAWVYLKYTAFQAKSVKLDDIPSVDDGVMSSVTKEGVYVIPDFFDQATCDEIKNEIDTIVDNQKELLWVDSEGADHRIYGAEVLSDKIREQFHENEELRDITKAHYKTDFETLFTLGAKLEAKETNLGSGHGWHRDAVFYPQFKAIVYLTDVTLDNGPYQYVKGSHTEKDIISKAGKGIKFNQNRFEHEEILDLVDGDESQISTFTAKAGTLILTETRGLHRGMPIKEGTRYALTNYYYPSYMKMDKIRKKWHPHLVKTKLKN